MTYHGSRAAHRKLRCAKTMPHPGGVPRGPPCAVQKRCHTPGGDPRDHPMLCKNDAITRWNHPMLGPPRHDRYSETMSGEYDLGFYGSRPGFLWYSPCPPMILALESFGFRLGCLWFSSWAPMAFALGAYGFRPGRLLGPLVCSGRLGPLGVPLDYPMQTPRLPCR